jgi:addiction module HigA family antidote
MAHFQIGTPPSEDIRISTNGLENLPLLVTRRAVTADTAMRLARFFNMSPEFWMGLQADYEVALARQKLASELKAIQPMVSA